MASSPILSFGVHASDVSQEGVVLWAAGADHRATAATSLQARFVLSERDHGAISLTSTWAPLPTHPESFTVAMTGLHPATSYRYVLDIQGSDRPLPEGHFTTLPGGTLSSFTLAWSADLGGQGRCRTPEKGYAIFSSLLKRAPACFVFLGDTVYTDSRCPSPPNLPGSEHPAVTLKDFRAKYFYQYGDSRFRRFLSRVPVLATWDDHEVENDFSDATTRRAMIGRQSFLEHWPTIRRDRLYRHRRIGDLAGLWILDTRSYRSPNRQRDGPTKTMLGRDQLQWLLKGLKDSTATWKLIACSVPISFPTGNTPQVRGRDGWADRFPEGASGPGVGSGFEAEFTTIYDAIRRHRITGVIFLSADTHAPHVILYHTPQGHPLFLELIAGPLSGGTSTRTPLDPTFRPTLLYADTGFMNFGLLTLSPKKVEVKIIDDENTARFRRSFTLRELSERRRE